MRDTLPARSGPKRHEAAVINLDSIRVWGRIGWPIRKIMIM